MAMDAVMLAGQLAQRGVRDSDRNGSAVARLAALVPAGGNAPQQRVLGKSAPAKRASRKARQVFLDHLMRSGDPAVAAAETGLNLLQLFKLRATDADFAADWQAAIGFAWERVEHRVLAGLLAQDGGVDSKVVLAIMARRDAGNARVQGRGVDSASVARVRAELRALAGPVAVKGR